MPICKTCKQLYTHQTLEDFFKMSHACPVCKKYENYPIRKEEYPLYQNTLITLTFLHKSNQALNQQVFEGIYLKGFDCFWLSDDERLDAIEIKHLIRLLKPLMIYHCSYIDFKMVEMIIENDDF